MCHRASASDQEESPWVAGRGPSELEVGRLAHEERAWASLLGRAGGLGKQQFSLEAEPCNKPVEDLDSAPNSYWRSVSRSVLGSPKSHRTGDRSGGDLPTGASVDENSAKFLAVPLLFGSKWVPDESERQLNRR
jgi:hypothetical protein